MNRAQFEDPVSHMCFAGAVVAQVVAGSSPVAVSLNSMKKPMGCVKIELYGYCSFHLVILHFTFFEQIKFCIRQI